MNGKNRQQLLLVVAGLALALLLGDRWVLTPLTESWKARSARIAELRKSISQGGLLIERENTVRKRWDNMRDNTLPHDVSAAENQVLQAFERWSQESRISVTAIKPQWKRASEDYLTLECRVDAFGGIQALSRFLYNIERDPLAIRVEAVEITARDNEGQQLALGLQVSGLLLNPQEP